MIEYKLVGPGAGKLLIAEPFMSDESFKRSVVLLSAYNEDEGAVGFVLNHPSDYVIGDLMPDFANAPHFNPRVFIGGPVQQDTLHFVHRMGNKIEGALQIGRQTWWGGNSAQLSALIQEGEAKESEIRFFLGYSGWSVEQLAKEIEEKSWIVTENFEHMVFDTDTENDYWRKIISRLGDGYREVANYPENVHWN